MQGDYRVGDVVEVRSKRRPVTGNVATVEGVSPQYLTVWFHSQDRSVMWSYTHREAMKYIHRYF